MSALVLHPDRLFPAEPGTRVIARRLHEQVASLPIVSPHGHTDPRWFATNASFDNATELLLRPDHYLLRMLMSQGIPLEGLGVPTADGTRVEADPRAAWRLFAEHYYLFRGTPSKLWLDWVLGEVFGIGEQLDTQSADAIYDLIGQALVTDGYRPRALFDRFRIEVLATTESPLHSLDQHQAIPANGLVRA